MFYNNGCHQNNDCDYGRPSKRPCVNGIASESVSTAIYDTNRVFKIESDAKVWLSSSQPRSQGQQHPVHRTGIPIHDLLNEETQSCMTLEDTSDGQIQHIDQMMTRSTSALPRNLDDEASQEHQSSHLSGVDNELEGLVCFGMVCLHQSNYRVTGVLRHLIIRE